VVPPTVAVSVPQVDDSPDLPGIVHVHASSTGSPRLPSLLRPPQCLSVSISPRAIPRLVVCGLLANPVLLELLYLSVYHTLVPHAVISKQS